MQCVRTSFTNRLGFLDNLLPNMVLELSFLDGLRFISLFVPCMYYSASFYVWMFLSLQAKHEYEGGCGIAWCTFLGSFPNSFKSLGQLMTSEPHPRFISYLNFCLIAYWTQPVLVLISTFSPHANSHWNLNFWRVRVYFMYLSF